MFLLVLPSQNSQLFTQTTLEGLNLATLLQIKRTVSHEAADLLNVSRPYLDKLLDEGIIPSRKVGVYRRVRAQDVMRYKQAERQRQEGILDELAKEAQDLDLGY